MNSYRIKDEGLASQIDERDMEWTRYITPITQYACEKISKRDYSGKKMAYWGHILQQSLHWLIPLKQTGVEIVAGACNVDSTDDAAAAYLVAHGINVYGWKGMTQQDYQENMAHVRAFDADYLCAMGGDITVAYLSKQPPVKGALEATTSGIKLLEQHSLPFPVFDWNGIRLKDRLENRFHVGDTIWPAFSLVTGGLSLFGRRVLVIGYGPVGKGIAERARNLGAIVAVAEKDPLRLLEARYHGCETVSLEEGLSSCHIIVTATGVDGVLKEKNLLHINKNAFVFNAGHTNKEIDIDWLYSLPYKEMKDQIDRFDLGETHFFLLGKGSLLNLAVDTGAHGTDLFDHYTAVMLLGMAWMFDGIPDVVPKGIQPYPVNLEQEIAELSLKYYFDYSLP